ncbi:MAG: periplasmic-type flagellar collar protein FlcA, partial [Spirochaetaceae bacterium]
MPTRDSIEEFNRTLVTLGNEPAVRARRNEDIEQIAPPEEGLSEDLSELLGDETGEGGEGAAAEPAAEDEFENLDELVSDEELAGLTAFEPEEAPDEGPDEGEEAEEPGEAEAPEE